MGLKIACIYYSSLGDWRGGSAGLKNMLSIFDKLGIETTDVISYSYESNKFGIEQRKLNSLLNSTIIHFPSNLSSFIKAFSVFFGFIYTWRPFRKCDIIFAHLSITSAVPAVVLGKVFNKPVIFHYIDIESIPVFNKIFRYIVGAADVIFAISPNLVSKVKNYKCENVVFLPAFVDVNLFKMDVISRRKIRDDLGLKNGDILVGYTGAFSYTEGIPKLLRAFKHLSKRYPNVKLLIVGGKKGKNDDDVPQLVKRLDLEDIVKIVPPQPHDDIPKFLSACDITCCPKIDCEDNRAALPIKVVEYISMGIPSVCSSVGGISYIIEDGVDGFLVKPGDVKNLEKTLEWVILNPKSAREIGENGRKKAVKEFSFDVIENVVKEAIKGIIEKR
jgi:glycosyltransferase involved in cell wall biosynthesis